MKGTSAVYQQYIQNTTDLVLLKPSAYFRWLCRMKVLAKKYKRWWWKSYCSAGLAKHRHNDGVPF